MIVGTAVVVVAVFLLAFRQFRVGQAATSAVSVSRSAMGALQNPDLDDRAREKAVRQASIRLMVGVGSILGRGVLVVLASAIPIWLADTARLAPASEVVAFLSRWDVILGGTVLLTAAYVAWRRLWRGS